MNTTPILAVLLLLASCTAVLHPTAGNYVSLGGDTSNLKADAGGFTFAENSNSAAFRDTLKHVRLSWQSYIVAEGLKFLSGRYYDHEAKVVENATTIKLEQIRAEEAKAAAQTSLETVKALR